VRPHHGQLRDEANNSYESQTYFIPSDDSISLELYCRQIYCPFHTKQILYCRYRTAAKERGMLAYSRRFSRYPLRVDLPVQYLQVPAWQRPSERLTVAILHEYRPSNNQLYSNGVEVLSGSKFKLCALSRTCSPSRYPPKQDKLRFCAAYSPKTIRFGCGLHSTQQRPYREPDQHRIQANLLWILFPLY
jgi:hypothetical protein